ncbi:MAG: hypothetical protein V4671_15725 [Armatimonadota bacterium]
MDFISTFFGLAYMACYNALFLYPAAALLTLAGIFWLLSWKNWRDSDYCGRISLVVVPSLATVLILICGAVFRCGDLRPCANVNLASTGIALMNASLLLEIPLILWTVSRLQKLKSVVIILGVLQFWYALLAAGMGHMSITGVWL